MDFSALDVALGRTGVGRIGGGGKEWRREGKNQRQLAWAGARTFALRYVQERLYGGRWGERDPDEEEVSFVNLSISFPSFRTMCVLLPVSPGLAAFFFPRAFVFLAPRPLRVSFPGHGLFVPHSLTSLFFCLSYSPPRLDSPFLFLFFFSFRFPLGVLGRFVSPLRSPKLFGTAVMRVFLVLFPGIALVYRMCSAAQAFPFPFLFPVSFSAACLNVRYLIHSPFPPRLFFSAFLATSFFHLPSPSPLPFHRRTDPPPLFSPALTQTQMLANLAKWKHTSGGHGGCIVGGVVSRGEGEFLFIILFFVLVSMGGGVYLGGAGWSVSKEVFLVSPFSFRASRVQGYPGRHPAFGCSRIGPPAKSRVWETSRMHGAINDHLLPAISSIPPPDLSGSFLTYSHTLISFPTSSSYFLFRLLFSLYIHLHLPVFHFIFLASLSLFLLANLVFSLMQIPSAPSPSPSVGTS
jgi:hypothetical protein